MINERHLRKIIREALAAEIRFVRNDLGVLSEARVKSFEKVMRQVYDNLPDHVFNDMYSQEKQWSNIFDKDIGPYGKKIGPDDKDIGPDGIQNLASAVLRNQPNALENFREFERRRGSVWIDTVWDRRARNLNLRWKDLSEDKRNFFIRKYMGKNENFPARTEDKHGYLDKIERLLLNVEKSSEPVILLHHDETGYDIIGGNNRTFAAFFLNAIKNSNAIKNLYSNPQNQNLSLLSLDVFGAVFEYLNSENPAIQISAFVGKKVS